MPCLSDGVCICCMKVWGLPTTEVSSYGVRVVGLIGNNLGGVHMGAGQASGLPARLRKCREGLIKTLAFSSISLKFGLLLYIT